MGLLEGAGFSKSNPYFIVQQGKVNALCTMSDEERLNLLKEVAGTTVYDEKKKESLLKMEENNSSILKINEMMDYIDSRLSELQNEKEELTKYQKLDRERRCVEYTLYDLQLKKARQELDQIELSRNEDSNQMADYFEDARATHNSIKSVEAKMKQKANFLRRNRSQLTGLEGQKKEKLTLKIQLENEVRELEESFTTSQELKERSKKELVDLQKLIEETTNELESTNPSYQTISTKLKSIQNSRENVKNQLEGLYAKQSRGQDFDSQDERDAFLKTQINELNGSLNDKSNELKESQQTLKSLEKEITQFTRTKTQKSTTKSQKTTQLETLSEQIEGFKKERNTLAEQRREIWRNLDELSEKLSDTREEHQKIQSSLRRSTPKATSMGLESLERIVQEENLSRNYYGTVMENIELVDPKYRTAVEVAAGNSLFHVVVDTDQTAATLMGRLEREKLGRVTFLPLNQLRPPQNLRYPQDNSDATPLLSTCLNYPKRVEIAMTHIFGRKLLARSVDIAHTFSQRYDMDSITLDGDLCSSKGALTGGFVDDLKSRLKLFSELTETSSVLGELESKQQDLTKKVQSVDQQVSSIMGEIQKSEQKRNGLTQTLVKMEDDLLSLENSLKEKQKLSEQFKSENIPSLELEIQRFTSQKKLLEKELGTELSAILSEEERNTLNNLKEQAKTLQEEFLQINQDLDQVNSKRTQLKSLLENNLYKKKQELESNLKIGRSGGIMSRVGTSTNNQEELDQKRTDFLQAQQDLNSMDTKLQSFREIEQTARDDLVSLKNELEALKIQDETNRSNLEKQKTASEKLLTKRSMVIAKRETNTRKIQELGSLPPSNELEQFSRFSLSKLMKHLEELNKKIKQYSHVNKKAYDQYVSFHEERERLLGRKQDLDQGAEKVQELIENLDRKKDEAINRTFRGVSSHFKDVFKELVPLGEGELIMRTAHEESESDDESSEMDIDPNNPNVDLYRGIGIKVRFTSVGENYLMSQLSGGQKALVALALIFAIQRCDPAPFYLFDELDQALDSTYRAAVANVISKQAQSENNPTQFIVSTFRPELVGMANRCFGISYQNKVSSFHLLSKKDALHFIKNLMSEEEAVGQVQTSTKSRSRSSKQTIANKRKRNIEEKDEEMEESTVVGEE